MIEYYMTRWVHLNLIASYNRASHDSSRKVEVFMADPAGLLETFKQNDLEPFPGLED
jgi:hypothetical protein